MKPLPIGAKHALDQLAKTNAVQVKVGEERTETRGASDCPTPLDASNASVFVAGSE